MKVNVALVGCGKVADQHIAEIQKLGTAEVVAVCDRELLMAEQLASRYGVYRYYSDFNRLLGEVKPDVVHVTTPPQAHASLAIQALDAGCHIFVEKPLALDREETKYLIDYAVRKRRKMTVGYT